MKYLNLTVRIQNERGSHFLEDQHGQFMDPHSKIAKYPEGIKRLA